MVELARRRQGLGLELDARVGFVEGAPFGNPSTSCSTAGDLLRAGPGRFLARLDALVAPGGLLVSVTSTRPAVASGGGGARACCCPVRELNGQLRPAVEEAAGGARLPIEARRCHSASVRS
jgi:hypothetical protein